MKRNRILTYALLAAAAPAGAMGQTQVDLKTQARGLEKQGNGAKFQMAGSTIRSGGVAVYDADGNVVAGDCSITAGMFSCGAGSWISTVALPELSANGNNVFVIHGAPDQAADGCIVLAGQPAAGQVLRATGTAIVDDDGRACARMEWAAESGAGADAATAEPAPNAVPKAGPEGTLAGGWLPAPDQATKGGVQAKDCGASGQFVQSLNLDGSVTCGTPPLSPGDGAMSVGLTMPAQFTVTGSPVTGSGTIAVAANSQPANTVLAGPASGGAGAPAYRSLTSADMPAAALYSLAQFANSASAMSTSVRLFGHYLPYPVRASRILFQVQTADNVGSYGFGLYGPCNGSFSGCPLAAHTLPATYGLTGVADVEFVEGTVTLPAGRYYLAYGGSGTTLKLDRGEFKATFANAMPAGSWSGDLPATINTPADNWALWAAGIAVALH